MFKKKEAVKKEEYVSFHIQGQPALPNFPEVSKEKLNLQYPLIPPFASAQIFWDTPNKELVYFVREPELDEEEQKVFAILEEGIKELTNISYIAVKKGETVIAYLEKNVNVLISELKLKVSPESYQKLMYLIYRNFVGLNEIEPLMWDYFIEDVECNGINTPLYVVHRKYRNLRTNIIFKDAKKLTSFVEKLAQKTGHYISYADPLLDAALPDGSIDYKDPFIFREDGVIKIRKIGWFIDRYYKNEESNKPIHVNNIEVPAFDPKSLKMAWRSVNYVYRHQNEDKLYCLTLESGRKVNLTGSHSIFILRKDGLKSELTSNVKKGDYVAIPLSIPESENIKEINLAKELSTQICARKLVLENVPPSLFVSKKQEIKKVLQEDYSYPYEAFYSLRSKKYLPIKLYSLLSNDELRNCRIRTTSSRTSPTFLQIDNELMQLLGYYIAEGWLSNPEKHHNYDITFSFNRKEHTYHAEVKNAFKHCFDQETYLEPPRGNGVKIKCNSYIVWHIFKHVLNVSKYAKQKTIPDLVFNVDLNLRKEFIRCYRNGDYGSSASEELLSDLLYLHLFDNQIISYYERERDSIIEGRLTHSKEFYTNNLVRSASDYFSMIPMEMFNPLTHTNKHFANKRLRRDRLAKILCDWRYFNFKNIHAVNNRKFFTEWSKRGFLSEKKLTEKGNEVVKELDIVNSLLDSDLAFLKINKIEKIEASSQFVYDVSVQGSENFVGGFGGICCHNSRVNASFTEDVSAHGPSFTIRKFTKIPWSPIRLMQFGTISPQMLAFLWILIEYEMNIMIIGGTSSGKTSLLNALTTFIPPQARIVSIEDTRELALQHENWLPSIAREGVGLSNLIGQKYGEVSLFDLLKESFRQNPDYVIVGEIRGKEAYVLFQGMGSIRGDEEIFVVKEGKPLRIKVKDLSEIKNCSALTYDLISKEARILPIQAIVKHPERNTLYKIRTKKGREITLTPDHSVFTLQNQIISAPMETLKIGDTILIPSRIPCGYADLNEINLIEFLPEIRVYAPALVKKAVTTLGYEPASGLCQIASISDYYSNFKRSKPSSLQAAKFKILLKSADVPLDLDQCSVKFDRKSESFPSKIPVTPEFLRLLGYYLSEGTIRGEGRNKRIAFYNKNQKIINDMRSCITQVTGKNPRERSTDRWGTAIELSLDHKVLYEFLKKYCGRKEEKRIPDFIFGLSKEKIGQFISALYDGDGTFTKNYFGYFTISKKFANDVAQLLLTLGIVATLRTRNRVGRKTTDYEIVFYTSDERKEFLKYAHPLKYATSEKEGKKNEHLLGDLYIDTIKEIEVISLEKSEPVYDLAIPGTRNFIGGFGGILLHNSGHPSLGTMHANSVDTMIKRLETPPISLSSSLVETLDVVCVMMQTKVGGKLVRRISEIAEIIEVKENQNPVVNTPFIWNPQKDTFFFKTQSHVFKKLYVQQGINEDELQREMKVRTLLLIKLFQQKIFDSAQVADIIKEYYKDPGSVLTKFGIA